MIALDIKTLSHEEYDDEISTDDLASTYDSYFGVHWLVIYTLYEKIQ